MGATDSKLAFKKGVFRLFEERGIPHSANDYWEQFWILPESADDVFLLVGSQDIRRVCDEARENLECLIEKTLAHLFRLAESPQFPSVHAPASQALNCVRILTRLFPFVFESDQQLAWEEAFFWTPQSTVISTRTQSFNTTSTPPGNQPSTGTDQAADITPSDATKAPTIPINRQKEQEFIEPQETSFASHGQRLISTLQSLLFTSGFTLPTAMETKNRVSFVIWETGVGSSKPIGTTKELDSNRTEILRLLLVLFSRSMYMSPATITTTENRWIDAVVTSTERQATLATLCSLINSALKYNPSGWGLPYNHVMFSDQRELLVMLSLQVVIVLLDYQVIERPLGISNDLTGSQNSTSSLTQPSIQRTLSHEPGIKNQFRHYLSRLHREQDFLFLTDGLYRILSNPMVASSTYLPGSTKHIKYHHESLILCWKALELNKRFRTYLLETNRVLDIVVILLYYCMEYKQDPTHLGLVRMCAYILQTLSKDKGLGLNLNKTFDGHIALPPNMRIQNFSGTYGDYLICTVHHLITTTKRGLRALYPAFVATLANISPQLKNTSSLAASRLLQLTTSFASPAFLLAEESNHELLGTLLDTICSVLYYHPADNPCLVLAVVKSELKIQSMANFTLQRGLTDIHRLRYRPKVLKHPASANPDDTTSRVTATKPRDSTQHRQASQPRGGPDMSRRSSVMSHKDIGIAHDSWSSDEAGLDRSASMDSPRRLEEDSLMPSRPTVSLLNRPVSSESIMAASDGGGNDGDVEDEGGPSTKARQLTSDHATPTLSEKARGKLPEGRQSPSTLKAYDGDHVQDTGSKRVSDVPDARLGRRTSSASASRAASGSAGKPRVESKMTTAADVGQNGFVPTEEWVSRWMSSLRFDPLLVLLRHLKSELEKGRPSNEQALERSVISLAQVLHLILPESGKPPIVTRRFVWSELVVWFQGLMWSQIYIGGGGRLGRQGLGAWHETGVRLFTIRKVPLTSAAVTVTDNVASVAAAALRAAGSTFSTSVSPTSPTPSSPASRSGRPSMSSSRARPERQSSIGL
ncbi:hypothetical protein BGZ94_008699 [Podila epigama]|nr:hypothetical protein BGZ94_008699 [Podila epigama]